MHLSRGAIVSIHPTMASPQANAGAVPGSVPGPDTSPKPPNSNGGKGSNNLTAAAELIAVLDNAIYEANDRVSEARAEAEEARRNARAAAEVGRRYRTRSYRVTNMNGVGSPSGGGGGGGGGGGVGVDTPPPSAGRSLPLQQTSAAAPAPAPAATGHSTSPASRPATEDNHFSAGNGRDFQGGEEVEEPTSNLINEEGGNGDDDVALLGNNDSNNGGNDGGGNNDADVVMMSTSDAASYDQSEEEMIATDNSNDAYDAYAADNYDEQNSTHDDSDNFHDAAQEHDYHEVDDIVGNVDGAVATATVEGQDVNQESMSLGELMEPTTSTAADGANAAPAAAAEEGGQYEQQMHASTTPEAVAAGATNIGPLPAGWVEVLDESSGVPYYYREVDGYTTWERPIMSGDDEQHVDEQQYQQVPQQHQTQEYVQEHYQEDVDQHCSPDSEAANTHAAADEIHHDDEPQARPGDNAYDMHHQQEQQGWEMTTPGKRRKQQNVRSKDMSPFTAAIQNVQSPLSATRSPTTPRSAHSTRLAQSNAEDVLTLSLELEKVREELDKERSDHNQTKTELTEARAVQNRLEGEVRRLEEEREEALISHGSEVDGLRIELDRARHRVTAAEEDANLALDLAKGSAESREQLEGWLQRALDEIELLRYQLSNATAVGPGGGQMVPAIASRPKQQQQPPPPPPPPPRQQQKQEEEELGVGSPLTSIAEESTNNALHTRQQEMPPRPPPPKPHSTTNNSPATAAGSSTMQRSSSTRTVTTTTVTTTESSAVYMSDEGTAAATTGTPAPHQMPPPIADAASTATSTPLPPLTSAPPPVQTPASTPQRQPLFPKPMVAAGREILRKNSSAPYSDQLPEDLDQRRKYWSNLVRSAKEKQQKLKEKLDADDELLNKGPLARLANRRRLTDGSVGSRGLIDPTLVNRVAILLSESGTKLELGGSRRRNGRWGVLPLRIKDAGSEEDEGTEDSIDLESLVKDYCLSVEAKMGKAKEEIKELEAFCEYLESKVVTST